MQQLNMNVIHASWLPLVSQALSQMDAAYLDALAKDTQWMPGANNIFNAFSLPLTETQYVLFGESPYPRAASANGYAFWDQAVTDLWSAKGLSKTVNRATSLRNFIKMLLLSAGLLTPEQLTQEAISQLPKTGLIQSAAELFGNMQKKGILLLNASLVLSPHPVRYDAKAWRPFMQSLLTQLLPLKPDLKFILMGKIAEYILTLCPDLKERSFITTHPYNIPFIYDLDIQDFFRSFQLLRPLI